MPTESEAWDKFWTLAAEAAARHHAKPAVSDQQRLRMEQSLRRASAALAEARAAMKEIRDLLELFGMYNDADSLGGDSTERTMSSERCTVRGES